MEQPYVVAYPIGTDPSAPSPPQGGGVAGVNVDPRFCAPDPIGTAPPPPQGGGVAGVNVDPRFCAPDPIGTDPSAPSPPQGGGVAGVNVDPRFCAPDPVDLAIVRKMMKLTDGNFVITDVNGNLLFKVKEPVFGVQVHDKRILLDGSGSPVLTLREKMVSLHDRWQVFRGESTEQRDLLYTVKRSSILQFKKNLDVFLSHNKEEKRCDFRVKGSWLERSCVVYAGESDAIVALMHKKHTVQSVFLGKDNFSVTVYPNVDYAFIASLVVILDDVNREDRNADAS